jgi:hypothetical protein
VLDRTIDNTQKEQSWNWKLASELVTVQDNLAGKPDACTEPATCEANLHVRFDEGECRDWHTAALHSLLYWPTITRLFCHEKHKKDTEFDLDLVLQVLFSIRKPF